MLRFSKWSEHSSSSVLPQSYPQPYSISQWLLPQGMRLVAAAVERWTHTVVAAVHLGEHKLQVLASRRGWGSSSSWDYRCCHTGYQLVAYFSPQHLHVQPLNPLLR